MLKIIFAGTPEFAIPTLEALLQSQHQIIAIYTQPDRPAGRGRHLRSSPVKQIALQKHIPIYQPITLRNEAEQNILNSLHADLMVVIAYGLILPKNILEIPRYGCINVHASLLPRWRGAAPIQRAILAGDKKTGITIMQMNAGLDTGNMLQQTSCTLEETTTSQELHDVLSQLGAKTLLETLTKLEAGQLKSVPQDNTQATYAAKIEKQEAKLNWQDSAINLDRKIRAFNPWPVAFTEYKNEIIRIWRAIPLEEKHKGRAGVITHVSKYGIDVNTGEGILRILEMQFANGRRLSIVDILNAKKDFFIAGQTFIH